MAKILYVGTHGTDDPTNATFPFLMAKGAIDAGHETGIILQGEAAPLIKDSIAAQIQGVGVPSLTELMAFLVEKNVRSPFEDFADGPVGSPRTTLPERIQPSALPSMPPTPTLNTIG